MRKYDWDAIRRDYLRGLSFPKLRQKYGISYTHARHILLTGGISPRDVSEALLFHSKGWRKLNCMSKSGTRILSLPYSVYKQLGFEVEDELEGQWEITNDWKLVLHIRKVGKEKVKKMRKSSLGLQFQSKYDG